MNMIVLYNSLTRTKEQFVSLHEGKIGLYTCGPTVYDHATIGNWRTYTFSDMVVRMFRALDFDVSYIMNITDVGHLTGDNEGDADTGDDRLEKQAKKENKSAWDIAAYYTDAFYQAYKHLGLTMPDHFVKATDHIDAQIQLIKKIEQHGFSYKIKDGIYFDVKAYEKAGNTYGTLSDLDKLKEGARVEPNPEKKDPRDFALWKFCYEGGRAFDESSDDKGKKRHMMWDSPWGLGFPGWHIECSAMSTKYLGDQFDIHIGGEDLKSTHHPNEIAQAEAATGKKPFVRYWLHGAFLTVDGGRMGKSLGNAYTIPDIIKKGYDPLDLRYFYMGAHYRKKLNFTWEALDAARSARQNLSSLVSKAHQTDGNTRTTLSDEKLNKVKDFSERFYTALADDFNIPEALSVVWEMIKSNIPSEDKYELAVDFDRVLGLNLSNPVIIPISNKDLPDEVKKLVKEREEARSQKRWQEADAMRKTIEESGYILEDSDTGTILSKRAN